ncbi:hypothetical protein D3C71_430730 [compost metagenome]
MAASASPISAAMKPTPSSARKDTVSAAMASTSAATRRARPVDMPAKRAGSAFCPADDATGSGLKPAWRMASSAAGSAPSSVVRASVRSLRRKRRAFTPATGSRARRISDSSTAQSMVGMRNRTAPFGRSAGSVDAEVLPHTGLPQQAVAGAAGA